MKTARTIFPTFTREGTRQHMCERCGCIFECDDCTEVMIQAALTSGKNRNGSDLYAALHEPRHEKPFLCEACDGQS